MTKQEELTYLFGILSEASKWTASEDDNRDLVRMEVEERIHNLINDIEPAPDENGLIQSSIHPDNPKTVIKPGQFVEKVEEPLKKDDFKALEAAKLSEHLASPEKVWKAKERWKADKVRCNENGHIVWRKRCECIQQPRDNSKGGPAWMWKWMGPATTTDKQAQEEQMWEQHEKGEE